MVVRGIRNVSGVSCHLTSALQILLHSVIGSQVWMCWIQLADCNVCPTQHQDLHFLSELARLFQDLSREGEPVNPSTFLNVLSQLSCVDTHDLGDAVTGLRTLLSTAKQCIDKLARKNKDYETMALLLDQQFFSGSVHQTLEGYRLQDDDGIVVRTKTKICSMACPLVLDSAIQELMKSTRSPVTDYNWDMAQNYTESRQSRNNHYSNITDEWTTCKSLQLENLPDTLLLHLQSRFMYHNGRVKVLPKEIDVPPDISVDGNCYELTGALVHSSDSADGSEEEDGHYVALLNEASAWVVADDENVRPISHSMKDILNFLSCRPNDVEISNTDQAVATLVAYRRSTNEQQQSSFTFEMSELRNLSSTPCPCNDCKYRDPQSFVGRRLRVKWAKGKFYSGIVESFNQQTGKHVVRYDDGDVREYVLRKKTVEWED